MDKMHVISRLIKDGLIVIVRTETELQARRSVETLIKSGIKNLEITTSVPNALKLIAELNYEYEANNVLIGAGTVLNETTATVAIISGAKFLVSPFFDSKIAKVANFYQIPYLPGVFTPKEIRNALEYGCSILKLFPASDLSTNFIQEIKGPMPQATLMPTGGVSLENLDDWFIAGAEIVAVGGDLTHWAMNEEWDKMYQTAQNYLKVIYQIKSK
ncbi:bifunctional 2-keto-4-hydroxyglutarate aldolase/2-keto-3-deoxy-6-phosphogluconate aldolase [Leuconostoc citreum]|uniref:bifunctional 2-keto-4-hydroxyglutarate aldolase/2-keto-3-deoxy-6-phosphogluconate aldolase n=1 Tax=Leuconostoc citreum TaxID=33964 RepID=UPI0011BAE765|nr:bifunctional 2-keto-4-hydroxyglutarate aldolase/2-keto-3-deoxy-6-phosphogluconate aldolase [Leuconostoc citreum]QEA37564.1 bifunctional 4-hydroxy-2-oxoglutarate aldolase/2-dehydro-3-deoxy-phosphogluconate aldolase [Leuconostoc citreum]